jgi:hypothetical protein
MAPNRSTTIDAVTAVSRHTVRLHIAALSSAGVAVAGWARAADRFAQTVGDELLRRVDRETDSAELIVRVASAADTHLRDLAAIPRAAATHFDARISRPSTTD